MATFATVPFPTGAAVVIVIVPSDATATDDTVTAVPSSAAIRPPRSDRALNFVAPATPADRPELGGKGGVWVSGIKEPLT
jgi:hypothetical protein